MYHREPTIDGRRVIVDQTESGAGSRFAIRCPPESPPEFLDRMQQRAVAWIDANFPRTHRNTRIEGQTVWVEVLGRNGEVERKVPLLEQELMGGAPEQGAAAGS